MNREALAREAASKTQMSRRRVSAVLNEFLSEVTEALSRDERVMLRDFGSFTVKSRKARMARDLNSNVEMPLSGRDIPHFVPFGTLKDTVAQQSPGAVEHILKEPADQVSRPVGETRVDETRKDISAMLSRAEILADKGKFEQAIQQYRRILEQNPGHTTAIGGLGKMFYCTGDRETALQQYNRALKNDPGHTDTLVARAVLFAETGKYEEAKADLLRALEYEPPSFEACYQLGVLYITVGSYDAAIRMLTRALETDRSRPEVHLELGKAYCHVERHAEAIGHFETLLRHEPDNGQAYRYLGLIYDKDRQIDKALEMYRKSNEISLS